MKFELPSKKVLITSAVIGVVLITGAGAAFASQIMNKPKLTAEQKTAIEAARKSGGEDAVKTLLTQYGVTIPQHGMRHERGMRGGQELDLSKLSAEDKTAFETAKQNHDFAAVKVILDKYGITPPMGGMRGGQELDLSKLSAEDK
ncbi:MAG: hypothetical protein WCJ84_05060, partial [Candidatus Peregrinibacteria bacterium]